MVASLGHSRRRDLDPTGATNQVITKIVACCPGHMIHLDVKEVGRVPDGGGWRTHGCGSEAAKAVERVKAKGAKAGYVYLHSAIDGFSRLAYTEALPYETAKATNGFWARGRALLTSHGVCRFTRVVTDNGSNYRAKDVHRTVLGTAAKHQRIRPHAPKHNGKAKRYNRSLSEEVLYAAERTSEAHRTAAIGVWNIHYNYHRPESAIGNRSPAALLPTTVTNARTQNN